ncbi:MAG: hypothetical protein DRI57_00160 [Deltaproteobacteria bacterium]|nr:MAG: hypothetical protein DRI57_00160 [Deltaproteobacteria bacterium]
MSDTMVNAFVFLVVVKLELLVLLVDLVELVILVELDLQVRSLLVDNQQRLLQRMKIQQFGQYIMLLEQI